MADQTTTTTQATESTATTTDQATSTEPVSTTPDGVSTGQDTTTATEPAKPQKSAEEIKLKNLLDKATSELAAQKKAAREKMTADEAAAADAEVMRQELEELRAERAKNQLVRELTKVGITDADDIAGAFIDNDPSSAIAGISKFYNKQIKDLQKEVERLKTENTGAAGTPPAGTGAATSMSLSDAMKQANNDPAAIERILAQFKQK